RLRRLLLVLVTDFVEPDINDVSVEFRPRWQRKRQALFDIDEWNVCLGRRNGDRNPFELGDDGLRLWSLAYDRIAQGNIDLTRPAHRSEYDASLNAHLDAQVAALHRAFAGGLAERKLVAQIPGGRIGGLGGNIHRRSARANIDSGAFDFGRRRRGRVRLSDTWRRTGEKAREPASKRGRVIGRAHAGGERAAGQQYGTHDHRRGAAQAARLLPVISPTHGNYSAF